MSAEMMRQAAALMRERAEAATHTCMPWGVDEIGAVWAEAGGRSVPISSRSTDEDAEHIASWHPAVALAVADWLDSQADFHDEAVKRGARGLRPDGQTPGAFAVARAYLGMQP